MTIITKIKDTLRRRPKQLDLEDYLAKMASKGFDKNGNFKMDPTPIAPPIGYKRHPTMVELIRDMIAKNNITQGTGAETFEESEDFDVDDDGEQLRSPHENEGQPQLAELLNAGAQVAKYRGSAPAPSDAPLVPEKPAQDPPSDGPAIPPKPPAKDG